jgi:hypothetical protein
MGKKKTAKKPTKTTGSTARTASEHGEPDPLHPTVQLLVAIGSAVVHAEEYLSPNGDPVDRTAFETTVNQPEVQAWIKAMGPMLPLKRNP